jgi:RNA polymerase-binding transcription factor DksA
MATSKKSSPKNKASEMKGKKKASDEIKKKPLKAAMPDKSAIKQQTIVKSTSAPKGKKTADKPVKQSTDKSVKHGAEVTSKIKPAATKSNEKQSGKPKSKDSVVAKNDKKIEKVIAAVSTKGKKAAGKGSQKKATQTSSSKTVKKAVVAVFTMENVREVLKNRHDEEAREQAEQKDAALKKSSSSIIVEETPKNRVLGAATLADILGFGVAAKKPESTIVDGLAKRDVPEKFRKYYDALISLRERIQKKINQRSHAEKESDKEATVAVPAQTDDDDTFDHDFALSLVANEQDALVEVNSAIERIFDGTYGICEITGHPISAERLDAVPFARYSVEGQAQYEMQNRRRAQRTTAFLDSSDDAGSFSGEDADE